MIPILDYRFSWGNWGNGIARLNDCISCIATEERNGKYALEMTYPVTGKHFKLLQPGMTIYAKTSEAQSDDDVQTFFIEKVNPTMNGKCKIIANHCSYELNWAILAPKVYEGTMDEILLGLYDDHMGTDMSPIYLSSDGYGTVQRRFTIDKPRYLRTTLGGTEGSIIDLFGGEWEWDNHSAILHKSRGKDNGAVIRYGKNLTGANVEWSISNYYDFVVAYWQKENVVVMSDKQVSSADGGLDSSTHRGFMLDCSGDYDTAPTKAALNARALNYASANAQKISMTASIKFQPLWQTTEYADIAALERVSLCDTVTVKHPDLGLDIKTKVTKTVYDVLKERYTSVSLGTLKKSFTDIVAEMG